MGNNDDDTAATSSAEQRPSTSLPKDTDNIAPALSTNSSEEELDQYLHDLIDRLERGTLRLDTISDDDKRTHNKNILGILNIYERKLAAKLRQSGSVVDEAQITGLPTLMNELVIGEGLQQVELAVTGMMQEMSKLNDDLTRHISDEQQQSLRQVFDLIKQEWTKALDRIMSCSHAPNAAFLHETIRSAIDDDLIHRTAEYFRNFKFADRSLDAISKAARYKAIEDFVNQLPNAQANSWNFWQNREKKASKDATTAWSKPSSNIWYPHYANECGQYAETVFLGEQGFEPAFPRRSIYLKALLKDKKRLARGHLASIGGGIAVKDLRRTLQVLTLTELKYASKAASYDPYTRSFTLPFESNVLSTSANLRPNTVVAIGLTAKSYHYSVIHGELDQVPNEQKGGPVNLQKQRYRWSLRNAYYHEYMNRISRRLNPFTMSAAALLGGESTLLPVKAHNEHAVKEIIEDLKALRPVLTQTIPVIKAKSAYFPDFRKVENAWFTHKPRGRSKLEKFTAEVEKALTNELIRKVNYSDGNIRLGTRSYITNVIKKQMEELNEHLVSTREPSEAVKAYRSSLEAHTHSGPLPILSRTVDYSQRRRIAVGFLHHVLKQLVEAERVKSSSNSPENNVDELRALLLRIMDRKVEPSDIKFFKALMPATKSPNNNDELFSVVSTDLNSMGLLIQGLIRFSRQRSFGEIARDYSCLKVAVMRTLNQMPAWSIDHNGDSVDQQHNHNEAVLALSENRAAQAFQKRFASDNYLARYVLNDNFKHDYVTVHGTPMGNADGFSFYRQEGSRVLYVVDERWLKRAIFHNGTFSIPANKQRLSAQRKDSAQSIHRGS